MTSSQPSPSAFLFVNKDPSSGSLSNSHASRNKSLTILSHTQRNSWRAGRRKRKPIPSATRSLVGWRTKTSAPESVSSTDDSSSPADSLDSHENSIGTHRLGSAILSQSTSILPVLDSVSSSTFRFDAEHHSILQYFTTTWMPSETYIPPNCHIGGMSPLYENDAELSTAVVRSSLLSDDKVHLYALLAASSSRMRFVARANLGRPAAFEFYTHEALQALQTYLAHGGAASDRLILDLCYLTLAEIYAQHPTRPRIYWQMMKPFVIACGGFHKVSTLSTMMVSSILRRSFTLSQILPLPSKYD